MDWWKNKSGLAGRLVLLMVGLFLYGLAIVIVVKAELGLGSWDVLHKGISLHTPLTFGQAGQVTGLVIIGLAFVLGVKPGIGTLANMFFVGFWIDVLINTQAVPAAAPIGGLVAQLAWVVAAILLLGLATGLYLKAQLGAGPRDSLMLSLVKRTGWRVAICRVIIEITVCTVGWLMGGTVGIATLMVAFGIGPSVEVGLRLCRVRVKGAAPSAPALETATNL